MTFLHGALIQEPTTSSAPIPFSSLSVIGVIGTAPDSEGASAATGFLGRAASDNELEFTAIDVGGAGNAVSISITIPANISQSLAIDVDGQKINVSLETDSLGDVVTTADALKTALLANSDVSAIISVSGSGSGVVGAGIVGLSGGKDESFPLDTPTLLSGGWSSARSLGDAGTLLTAVRSIFEQGSANVVVIRVADSTDTATQIDNIVGGYNAVGNGIGVQAFLSAKAETGFTPKILIAPGFSDNKVVVDALISVADRVGGFVYADGPNTTDSEVYSYRDKFGSPRLMIVDPWVKRYSDGVVVSYPASAFAAGVRARTDQTLGFWHSLSNQPVLSIEGTSRPVDFYINDPTCRANQLNSNEITTVIQHNGFRMWGNRTTSSDSRWVFESVRRTADAINVSILESRMEVIDQPITKAWVDAQVEQINDFLRSLKSRGAILDGKAWVDPSVNTAQDLAQGIFTIDFDFMPPPPAELIIVRSRINIDYLEELSV